jgi:type VI secretion system secreted protein Hcp
VSADLFLKIEGVEGDSADEFHKKEIEIDHWNVGATVTRVPGKHAVEKVVHNISVAMRNGKTTPILLQACASGRKFSSAIITGRKAGGKQEEYVKIKMEEVIIANVNLHAASGDSAPVADMVLNFTKIEWEVKTQDDRGLTGMPVRVGYDIKTDRIA